MQQSQQSRPLQESYTYFRIEDIWNYACLQDPSVKESIELIKQLYGITQDIPWASAGVPSSFDKNTQKVVNAFNGSSFMHLTYYIILNDSRFTVLLLYRMLRALLPQKKFLIAEGKFAGTGQRRYFCTELLSALPSVKIAYDITYYFPERYSAYMAFRMPVLTYTYETVRFFEEAEYIHHIAWTACGVELLKPYPHTAIIEEQETDDNTVICFKYKNGLCFQLLFRYWFSTRARLAAPIVKSVLPPKQEGAGMNPASSLLTPAYFTAARNPTAHSTEQAPTNEHSKPSSMASATEDSILTTLSTPESASSSLDSLMDSEPTQKHDIQSQPIQLDEWAGISKQTSHAEAEPVKEREKVIPQIVINLPGVSDGKKE